MGSDARWGDYYGRGGYGCPGCKDKSNCQSLRLGDFLALFLPSRRLKIVFYRLYRVCWPKAELRFGWLLSGIPPFLAERYEQIREPKAEVWFVGTGASFLGLASTTTTTLKDDRYIPGTVPLRLRSSVLNFLDGVFFFFIPQWRPIIQMAIALFFHLSIDSIASRAIVQCWTTTTRIQCYSVAQGEAGLGLNK